MVDPVVQSVKTHKKKKSKFGDESSNFNDGDPSY